MRILIADGDEVLLETLQPYLRKRGHDVKIASHGLECIVTLCEFVPHLMVLDDGLLWGGCDGILSIVQGNPLMADVRVILIADSEMQFDAHAGTNVVDWLSKPFKLSDLLLKILSATACLQLVDSTSKPGTNFTSKGGHDERQVMLPQRWNPLRSTQGINKFPNPPP